MKALFRKKVEWDQEHLSKLWTELPELRTVISCRYAVEEKAYNDLPAEAKEQLANARTVKVSGYEFNLG